MAFKITITVNGADEIKRALSKVPADAHEALRVQSKDIAETLKDRMWYAARRRGRQAPRAASTLRTGTSGVWPTISASNTGRAAGLLFGSEFGMTRHSGWYNKPRYFRAGAEKQFRPHLGSHSYWFFSTVEQNQGWIASEWGEAAEQVVREWSA